MTRTDNIKKNLFYNIVKFATQMVLQFVLRTALIYLMGAEYIGLNGLFMNIFSFLSLAELGIGSAIAFSMYKPVAEGDVEKVKSLQALYKKFYLIITIIIGVVGFLVLPFLKHFIKGEVAVDINIYLLYVMYLVNALVGYFCAHKRALLYAYQRGDVENKVKTICLILMSIIQIAVLFIFKNYYLYYLMTILFSIIECVLIEISAKKLYPLIDGKSNPLDKPTKKEIYKNVAALSIHRVGGALINSTDNILISSLIGLTTLGVYSNYYLIITTLLSIYTLIANALTSSVGNMIASESKEYVFSKFKQVNFLFSLLTIFCTVCLFVLFQPFIQLWTGGGAYLLSFSTVILLCVSFFIVRMRHAVIIFKDSAGLYWYNKVSPIIEAIVNLVVSIVLGIKLGLNGIILGTIISAIVAPTILEPRVLFKHYFEKSVWLYVKQLLLDTLVMIALAATCYFVCSLIPVGGVALLIARFAVCISVCATLLMIIYLPTKTGREILKLAKEIIKKPNNNEK